MTQPENGTAPRNGHRGWVGILRELGGLGLAFAVLVGLFVLVRELGNNFTADMRAIGNTMVKSMEEEVVLRSKAITHMGTQVEELTEQNRLYREYLKDATTTNRRLLEEMDEQTQVMVARLEIARRVVNLETRLLQMDEQNQAIRDRLAQLEQPAP